MEIALNDCGESNFECESAVHLSCLHAIHSLAFVIFSMSAAPASGRDCILTVGLLTARIPMFTDRVLFTVTSKYKLAGRILSELTTPEQPKFVK